MPAAMTHLRSARRRHRLDVTLVTMVVGLSLGIIIAPRASNWFNSRAQSGIVTGWAQVTAATEASALEDLLVAADQYNARLLAGMAGMGDDTDPGYRSQLRNPGTDVMAHLTIPAIEVSLPIFHGVAYRTLDHGVGHLHGTSLPVGGGNTHAVIAAHSGITHNRLFTDIHDLDYHDIFAITVAGRRIYYQVDNFNIVPGDYQPRFAPVYAGSDHVTLITCTPIGINSHRLLVRGTRIAEPSAEASDAVLATAPVGEQFPTWALAWLLPTGSTGVASHLAWRKRAGRAEGAT